MYRLIIFIFFILTTFSKGQVSCTPTFVATDIYPPNSTSTNSVATGPRAYLCGPNTILYDTINVGCGGAYLNSNTTLYYKAVCSGAAAIWLKNNSSVIILPGTNSSIALAMEPLATYTNLAGCCVLTVACTSISFPTVNCSTGINESSIQKNNFAVWPNPSSTKINITLLNSIDQFADVKIINQLGEIVFDRKRWSLIDKEINIENLSNGTYFIQVKTKLGQQTEKLIVLR